MTLLVGADPLARAGLAMLLTAEGIELAEPVAPGPELEAALEVGAPDAVVWDMGLSGRSIDLLRDLVSRGILVMALAGDDDSAHDAFDAGVMGLLRRQSPPAEIAGALEAMTRGLVALDARIAAGLRSRAQPTVPLVEGLTPRELEVLQLLAQGLANRAIADRLTISEHTAKFHVNAILGKLGARTRTEGVVRAARLGLVAL